MDAGIVTLLLFGTFVVFLSLGLPIVFALGGVAMAFTLFLWGPGALYLIASSAYGTMDNFLLTAVPLFIFMGYILQTSGIADDFYDLMYSWMGPVRGGLAMGTIVICTVFAAMAGISGAATVTMGVIALPAMLRRNYNKSIALGSIVAGGALGILIPPSLMMIVYGAMSGVSVGKLFMGGILPGLLLSGLFISYIAVRCLIQKDLGPPLPIEERASWKKKLVSLKAVILPVLIILMVLGTIYKGVATPTEAAGMGAFGSLIAALVNRKLTWNTLKTSTTGSLRTSAMCLWLVISAYCFCSIYSGSGAKDLVLETLTGLPVNRYVVMVAIQFMLIILGMFLDPMGIIMIATPIFLPVITALGFDPLWFGILFTMNLEMAYLTPPLGFNLFYLKGVTPPSVTMADIYRSVTPFVLLQALGLAIVVIYPQIALWIPSHMLLAK